MKKISIIISLIASSCASLTAQSMEYFIEQGVHQHPEVQKWSYWEKAKESEVEEVKAWPAPDLQFGYGLFPVETRVGPQIFKAGISQAIKWPGLQNAKGNVVETELQITEAKKQLSKKEITYRIKLQYLNLYMINERREYLDTFHSVYEEIRTDRIRQMEGGIMGHYSDVLLTERGLEEIERRIEQLEYKWKSDVKELAYWAGLEELDTVEFESRFEVFNPFKRMEDVEFENYPSLESLEIAQERAEHQIELNEWSSYPQVMVGVDYLVNAARQDVEIPDNGRDALMPRVGLTLPFLSSKYSHAEEKFKAQKLAYESEKRDESRKIDQKIYKAQRKQEEAYTEYDMYSELVRKTEEIIDLTQAQIGAEHSQFSQFWDYQKDIVNYRLKQLDALEELYQQEFIIEKYQD
jgi:outer membrane protein TolC